MKNSKNILSIRIKELRTELDLTQEELALKLGLKGKSIIANYESDKITPSDEIKLKMCELFNCSMDYLMGKSFYKNYEEFKKIDDFVLNYQKTAEETEILAKTLNYINSHKEENIQDIINNAIKILPNERQEAIKKSILHLHYRYREHFSNYKNNISEILESEAKAIVTNLDNNILTDKKYYMCPVYGRISAGIPNWAEECIEGRLPIDPELMNILNPEECFFLRVNGESMNKEISNGSFALIRKTDIVENGEIAVVLVNGNEATLKKFSKQNELVILEPMSNDPSFTTQVYSKDTDIKVIGKYIGKMEMK